MSLRLFKGQADPASAWTDDEVHAHFQRQAAEPDADTAPGTGRLALVWVYIFNNERHFAHGWTLYWATGRVGSTSLR